MTTDTVSDNRLTPHEHYTEETGYNSWIHRSDDECATRYVGLYGHEYRRYSLHLRSLHRCDILTEEEDTIEDKSREHYPDTPCKSFLYCTDPDLVSSSEENPYQKSEYTQSWRDKSLQDEVCHHESYEDKGDIILRLEQYEEE